MNLNNLVLRLRNPRRDREQARSRLRAQGAALLAAATHDQDDFGAHIDELPEAGFPVGTTLDARGREITVRLTLGDAAAHWLIQGSTGCGKTSFALSFLSWALTRSVPIGVVDCKAGFFDEALRYAAAASYPLEDEIRARFTSRLAVINPFSDRLVPFNVCRVPPGGKVEAQAYEVTLALSRLFDASLSVHMQNIMRHLIVLLSEHQLSLVEAPLVLQDEVLRTLLVQRSQNELVRCFFFGTFPTLPANSSLALAARLQSLLFAENVRLMLGADALVDLRQIVLSGAPLFIFLGKGAGVPEEQVNLLGSLILQGLFNAVFATEGRGRPYHLFLDEFFHLLGAPTLEARFCTMLTTARSYRVHLAFVMHQFCQVSRELREALLGNADLIALFRTSEANAQHFGDILPGTDPDLVRDALHRGITIPSKTQTRTLLMERLQRLPDRNAYFYDRRRPYRAVRLRVPDLVSPHDAAGVSETEFDRFFDRSGIGHGGYARPRAELRAEITRCHERLRALLAPAPKKQGTRRSNSPGNGQPGLG